MEFIKIKNEPVEYQFVTNKRARTLSYVVKDGCVKVTAPPEVTPQQAQDFLTEKEEELFEIIDKIKTQDKSPYHYVDGEKFLYRGRRYTLEVLEDNKKATRVQLAGGHMFVYLPSGLDESEKKLATRSLVDTFFQQNALRILEELTEYYSRLMDIPYKPIKIKNQRSRWGSCSNKGSIYLNWRIIMAPNQVISYVVIHELAHLKYSDHSREFWALVGEHMPDYKRWKKWLADNSEGLIL
ncbi:MAG: M48 family metallopeptidase [Peptococcaceae bacterium]|nr:M48 family metallopeptidase [Peptococcaceae bacterium]